MSNIWISSDWHYGHKNIVRGTTDWATTQACRDFDTLEDHNNTLVNNINAKAKPDDIIYFLGDFSFGGKDNILEFRKRIKCNNIHLVFGNHDIHIRKNYNDCQKLFLSCNDILYKSVGKTNFIMCHYAMRTWDKAHHGTVQLYGHSHGTLPDYSTYIRVEERDENGRYEEFKKLLFKCMDVGIDTHPDFSLYHIDEIKETMDKRSCLLVDHHTEKTN